MHNEEEISRETWKTFCKKKEENKYLKTKLSTAD